MACLRNYVQVLLAVVFRDMPRTGGITYTTSPLRGSVCSSPLYVRMWHGKHITLRCDADVRPTCSRSQKEFKHPHKNRFPVRITKPPNLLAKDKAIPLQAWTGPEGSKKLRLPDFQDNRHMNVARLSALRTGRLYPSRKYSWYSFLLDRLCGLVVRVSGYRHRGLGFDSRRYQIF